MGTEKTYTDLIHGFKAKCGSPSMAWALIRNKCHELKLEVPTLDKIVEVGIEAKVRLSQEELEQIEDLAACNYLPEKIALYLDVDEVAFMRDWFNPDSLIRTHFNKGVLQAQFEIHQKQLEGAKSGNITSAQIYLNLSELQRTENLKKKIFYGSET
ncbi:hypothetical protein ACFFVB_18430 [Formosa undariae]|uniref:Uncharacterized protein n=1 Tax=Formosa undariae TaxID=1325436 RepID=A0ABV5F6Q3_9FLAO